MIFLLNLEYLESFTRLIWGGYNRESDIGGWLLQMFKPKNSQECVISEQEDMLA